jgi:hypothetical protein
MFLRILNPEGDECYASQTLHECADRLCSLACGECWNGGRDPRQDRRVRTDVLPLDGQFVGTGREFHLPEQLENENGKLKRLVTGLTLKRF